MVYKWRVINSNMIQTHAKEVFLWDNDHGVAVRVPVPSRPWKKLDNSFVAWLAADKWEAGVYPAPPSNIISPCKISYSDGSSIETDDDNFFFFVDDTL